MVSDVEGVLHIDRKRNTSEFALRPLLVGGSVLVKCGRHRVGLSEVLSSSARDEPDAAWRSFAFRVSRPPCPPWLKRVKTVSPRTRELIGGARFCLSPSFSYFHGYIWKSVLAWFSSIVNHPRFEIPALSVIRPSSFLLVPFSLKLSHPMSDRDKLSLTPRLPRAETVPALCSSGFWVFAFSPCSNTIIKLNWGWTAFIKFLLLQKLNLL